MKRDEIKTRCKFCLEETTVSLDQDFFICSECGERNPFDAAKYKYQRQAILHKVFGEKPEKLQNN